MKISYAPGVLFLLLLTGVIPSTLSIAESAEQLPGGPANSPLTITNQRDTDMAVPLKQRIVVGIHKNTDLAALSKKLLDAGAIDIMADDANNIGHLVITIDAAVNNKEFIEEISRIPEVRYAEPDSMKFSY